MALLELDPTMKILLLVSSGVPMVNGAGKFVDIKGMVLKWGFDRI